MNTASQETISESAQARISCIQEELAKLDYIPDPYAQHPVDPRVSIYAQELWKELRALMTKHSVDLPN